MQIAALKIGVVHVRDFQLAPGPRAYLSGDVQHVPVVKIEACDRKVDLGDWGFSSMLSTGAASPTTP